jgi:ArsR family metal-binding transcriptional regulator
MLLRDEFKIEERYISLRSDGSIAATILHKKNETYPYPTKDECKEIINTIIDNIDDIPNFSK